MNVVGEGEDGLKKLKRSRKPTGSTTLGPLGFTETELPTRELAWDGPWQALYIYVTDVQLSLHVALLTAGAGAVSDSVDCF